MLHLRNIEKNDTQISASYFPEGSGERGFVSVDIRTGKVIKSETTSFDEPLGAYAAHAAQALRKMVDLSSLPSDKVVMWY